MAERERSQRRASRRRQRQPLWHDDWRERRRHRVRTVPRTRALGIRSDRVGSIRIRYVSIEESLLRTSFQLVCCACLGRCAAASANRRPRRHGSHGRPHRPAGPRHAQRRELRRLPHRAVLNDAGQTAFTAVITGSNNTGLWSEGAGSLALVARRGSQAPGTPSGVNSAPSNTRAERRWSHCISYSTHHREWHLVRTLRQSSNGGRAGNSTARHAERRVLGQLRRPGPEQRRSDRIFCPPHRQRSGFHQRPKHLVGGFRQPDARRPQPEATPLARPAA